MYNLKVLCYPDIWRPNKQYVKKNYKILAKLLFWLRYISHESDILQEALYFVKYMCLHVNIARVQLKHLRERVLQCSAKVVERNICELTNVVRRFPYGKRPTYARETHGE